jgi:hypothetical protein
MMDTGYRCAGSVTRRGYSPGAVMMEWPLSGGQPGPATTLRAKSFTIDGEACVCGP